MSLYKTILVKEIQNLRIIADEDLVLQSTQHNDRTELTNLLEKLYIRYVVSANELSQTCDHFRDPENTELARRLWELAVARTAQIADEITRFTAQIFSPRVETLLQMQLTPDNVKIKIPHYFLNERREEIDKRKNLWEEAFMEPSVNEEEDQKSDISDANINLYGIQRRESVHTRRESVHTRLTSHTHVTQRSRISLEERLPITSKKDIEIKNKRYSTIIIFHLLRFERHITRKRILGMELDISPDTFATDKKGEEKSAIIRNKRYESIKRKQIKISENIRKEYSGRLEEDIEDELRDWYQDWVNETKEYPVLPPSTQVPVSYKIYGIPAKLPKQWVKDNYPDFINLPKSPYLQNLIGIRTLGGSALITNGDWIQASDYIKCREALSELGRNKEKGEKNSKPKRKEKDSKKSEPELTLKPTDFYKCLERIVEDWNSLEVLRQIYKDPTERIETEFKKAGMMELHLEVRTSVDEHMDKELTQLDKAYRKEHGMKPRKKPKQRKAKKGKGKVVKELENEEEALIRLAREGIFKTGKGHKFEDYIDFDVHPEVFNILSRLCILPLLAPTVHYLSPLTRSVCLVGPLGTGKRMLADIVISETGAMLFDLSPNENTGNLITEYGMKSFLQTITSLMKRYQPCVILVEDAEKLFYKKVPKSEKNMNLNKTKAAITKIIKAITVENRVILIGTSSAPWLAKKTFAKFFDALIPIGIPDYGMYSEVWRRYMNEENLSLERAPLAKVTHRLTTQFPTIRKILEETKNQPSSGKCQKILKGLAEDKDNLSVNNQTLLQYLSKTPLAKKHAKILEMEAAKSAKPNNRKK